MEEKVFKECFKIQANLQTPRWLVPKSLKAYDQHKRNSCLKNAMVLLAAKNVNEMTPHPQKIGLKYENCSVSIGLSCTDLAQW